MNKYWRERALSIQDEAKELALTAENKLQKVYEDELRASLDSYGKLVLNVADIQKEYRTNPVFRQRYNRISAHINQSFDSLSSIVDKDTLDLLCNVYKNTMIEYGVQSFNLMNKRAIEKIVTTPWCSDGLVFSDRVWKNTALLKSRLSEYLLSSVVKGESIYKTAREIQHTYGVSLNQAKRLVRTETAAIYTEAALDSYSEMNIEYYEIIGEAACGDEGLCPVDMVYRVDEAGRNDTPPFHPNCKCCIAPVPNYKIP